MAGITDSPRGFIPSKTFHGGMVASNPYPLAAANTALGKWDYVTLTAAGFIDRSAASDTQIVGSSAIHAAASAGTARFPVYDDPNIIYLCQSDAAAIVAADRFANYNIVVAAAVNNISAMELDDDTNAATATLPLKMLRLHAQTGNTIGANAAYEVVLNNHVLNSLGVTGV